MVSSKKAACAWAISFAPHDEEACAAYPCDHAKRSKGVRTALESLCRDQCDVASESTFALIRPSSPICSRIVNTFCEVCIWHPLYSIPQDYELCTSHQVFWQLCDVMKAKREARKTPCSSKALTNNIFPIVQSNPRMAVLFFAMPTPSRAYISQCSNGSHQEQ